MARAALLCRWAGCSDFCCYCCKSRKITPSLLMLPFTIWRPACIHSIQIVWTGLFRMESTVVHPSTFHQVFAIQMSDLSPECATSVFYIFDHGDSVLTWAWNLRWAFYRWHLAESYLFCLFSFRFSMLTLMTATMLCSVYRDDDPFRGASWRTLWLSCKSIGRHHTHLPLVKHLGLLSLSKWSADSATWYCHLVPAMASILYQHCVMIKSLMLSKFERHPYQWTVSILMREASSRSYLEMGVIWLCLSGKRNKTYKEAVNSNLGRFDQYLCALAQYLSLYTSGEPRQKVTCIDLFPTT